MTIDWGHCMGAVARRLLGEPNRALSSQTEWRYGTRGSLAIDLSKGVWFDHEHQTGGGVLALIERETKRANGEAISWLRTDLGIELPINPRQPVVVYPYTDDVGSVLFEVVRFEPKDFRQRRPNGRGGWIWNLDQVRRVPFHLPQLLAAKEKTVHVVEGEKDVLALERLGLVATCNPGGAGKWREEFADYFRGADVVILPDNDAAGEVHARQVAASLGPIAARARILRLPGLGPKEDVSDWIARGGTAEELARLASAVEEDTDQRAEPDRRDEPVTLESFWAYMPMHQYIFEAAGELWPAASVNARLGSVCESGGEITASKWLDKHRPVEQMTWAPGEPKIVRDRLISQGGWIEHRGATVFNHYRPPCAPEGDESNIGPWADHVRRLFGDDAKHAMLWLAHRVQRPGEKINHALVLGGTQGIGKDTILQPVKAAVGPWNFMEVSPSHLLGSFNGFVKSVILSITETRDLGEIDRYSFYEHGKIYLAAPPDVLRVNEKNIREYYVPNVCGVIMTTNHKTDGIYLPPDDRRHFVAWSELTRDDFSDDYWRELYAWYAAGGIANVAAWLGKVDLSSFDAKAPPPKTAAWHDIVAANRAPEDAEMADAIEALGNPDALTLRQLDNTTRSAAFRNFLTDRRNARQIPHRLEAAGYVAVRNEHTKDGLWKIGGRRQMVYARKDLAIRERIAAATCLVHR
ncbi:MAG TPA: DUF5906 domain-containing protein [Hyphomonadaceae bacterium]|nr:DUF5906 domain-containing protein [Hyphomonadaceae bacterium]